MAALNTLRTRGSILLTAVIGISLLAFLLGDGTSLFETKTVNVGSVQGQKFSIKDYAMQVDLMSSIRQYMTGVSSLSQQETELVQGQVWSKFIADVALLPSYKNLGLTVSDEELLDMANGVYISPVITQVFTDPSTGLFDKERVTQYVANLGQDASNRARNFWNFMETQAADNRMNEKFNNLVSQGMYVTSLQVDQSLVNNSNEYTIDYVAKSLSSIADDAIKVTDKDLRDYYNKHIARFKNTASTQVEYVTFDIVPSQDDYAEAEVNAGKVYAELAASTDIEQFVNYTSEQRFDARYYKKEELPEYVKSQIANVIEGTTFEPNFQDGVYSISRVSDVKVMPDSITLRSVLVDPTKNVDSIKNVISKGRFDEIVSTLSVRTKESTNAVTINSGDLNPQFADKILYSSKGDVVSFDVEGATQIVYIESVGQLVKKYQIGEVILTVTPSLKTEQNIYAKAAAFVNEVNGGKSFEEALANNQYIKRVASVGFESRIFSGMDNSREIVRWALTKKVGELSHIFTIGSVNIVAYIKDKTEEGVASFESVKEQIRSSYIEKAKMDMAVKELSGVSSLESLASISGVETGSASGIKFSTMGIPSLGLAPEVVGALVSLKEGTVSQGIPAGTKAAVVKVTAKNPVEGMDAAKSRVVLETFVTSYLDQRISGALRDKLTIEDERVIYY